MTTFHLYYAPEGKPIGAADATDKHKAVRKAPKPYKDRLGEVYAIDFDEWKKALNAIADDNNLEPKPNPTPHEIATWRNHFEAGLTPAQAWAATPWRRS